MTATERARRTAEADQLCAAAYEKAGGADVGAALVAVGGYGRAELAPYSDLDVVLVADEGVELGEVAERVWYPLWDSGSRLDHSVRSFPEMVATADADLKVALGLLDLRHLAGDPNLTLRLRATMLTGWRRRARTRLPELREVVRARHELLGELAHLSVPDLKEAEGGLRDATALNALVASWLVDVPHADLERCRGAMLNVRDELHAAAGRATDRIAPELWPELAEGLGLDDDAAAQRHVRELGRRITHLSRLTWRRVDGVLARPAARGVRRPVLDTLSPGIALSAGEVVLDATARPAGDPLLLLRAAALAAEHDAALGPATAARLVRECPPLPDPWPSAARHLFVRLLASGRGLLPVWETLDETGALELILPEWERIRMLPHASPIHRFTVDRHVVETCIEASALIRDVGRPDVLMVAALLHDIGKGGLTEHSVAGEPLARGIATRMGFDQEAVELIGILVRWHLLLAETATTRDLDDPATVGHVAERLRIPAAAELLVVLTEADARATSTKAWSTWRSGLIRDLGRRVLAELGPGPSGRPAPPADVDVPDAVDAGAVTVEVEPAEGGSTVRFVARDRVGLLADAAAVFALQRTSVRAAHAWSQQEYGVSVWEVAEEHLDPAVLRQRFEAITAGRVDPGQRLRPATSDALAPAVVVRPEASDQATVLEVRATDRPGTVHLVCAALARLGLALRSAHVDTLGPQAVDVFYVQEEGAGALSDERAADAAHAVRSALTGTAG
jgi:[protein-PII] uridylyltransferase